MADGRFRGTSVEQDGRFQDKQKKLLKTMRFPPEYNAKIDMTKINKDVIKPWIARKITGYVGFEDDVLINLIFNFLDIPNPDARTIQINLTGFLEGNTTQFMVELWKLLASAQDAPGGIPPQFVQDLKEKLLTTPSAKFDVSDKHSSKK